MRKSGVKTVTTETRTLIAANGPITYTLSRKNVRNINLRVRADGSVAVSAPLRMPMHTIDGFLREKAAWVETNRATQLNKSPAVPCRYTKPECVALFSRISDDIFPLFADLLGDKKPALKVRDMKTRWGVCNVQTRTLTFNMRLAEKPAAVQEYVVLHEYVHFLHPDHGPGFHAEMARLMPDYKARRKALRQP